MLGLDFIRDNLATVERAIGNKGVTLDLDARLAGDITGLTTALYALRTSSVNNFLPQQVVLGGSWRLTRDVKASFDATWIDWSAYVPPVAKLDIVLDIPPPDGGWPGTIQPPTSPAPTRVVPLKVAPGEATEFALAAQDGRRLIAWRWHLVDGQVVLDPYRAKIDTALGLLQGRGDESFAVFNDFLRSFE